MPRRKNADGDTGINNSGQPAKQPRVRKKKESSSICSTPTGEHPIGNAGMKLEQHISGMPPIERLGTHAIIGGLGAPGIHSHMQHPGLSNGTCGSIPGGPGPPPTMLDDQCNGPATMCHPFVGGHPQGPPFDFYQQAPAGPSGMPTPHFAPSMPMYNNVPPMPSPAQIMQMQQQQQIGQGISGPPAQLGPLPGTAGIPQPGQFHPGGSEQQEQTHPSQHMMTHPMQPHHPGVASGPGPIVIPPGTQLPPHQLPSHSMFPPGAFPRQPPGPLMFFPMSIPQPPFLEYRIQEMNRRLYQYYCQFYHASPIEQEQWWDAFAQEFFDDIGRMTLCLQEYSAEQGGFMPKQYTVFRRFIPRFFRSMFLNGVSHLHFVLRSAAQEMIDPQRIPNPEMFACCALNCENFLMVTSHEMPFPAEVHTECRVYVEFAPFNPSIGYRIRHWFIELRSSQEFYAKDMSNSLHQNNNIFEGMKIGPVTNLGLPVQTLNDLKLWHLAQEMQPIVERVKETNESPQMAMQQIVSDRMEMERHQRMAAATSAGAHIHTPPHNQHHGGVSTSMMQQHPLAGMMATGVPATLPQMNMGPMPIVAGSGGGNISQQQSTSTLMVEDGTTKQKPKRTRQRKNAAGAQTGATTNTSPPKGKKSGGGGCAANSTSTSTANATGAEAQTPPIGMPPIGFIGGPPPTGTTFHPSQITSGQMQLDSQYHHDVLTVGEPSMMGCEYGEQDERQISRVENTAFTGNAVAISSNNHPFPPPPGIMTGVMPVGQAQQMGISGGSAPPQSQQQQMNENAPW